MNIFDDLVKLARKRKKISVVGTRSHTRYGEEMCKMIIQNLAPYDPIICSGFAYGIDIVAHKAALANGLNTIACLAHDFNTLYPKEHKKYQNQIEKQGVFFRLFVWRNDRKRKFSS